MNIYINYTLLDKENGEIGFMGHYKITEDDIIELVKQKFNNDKLAYPINISKEDVKIDVDIDKVEI